MTDFHHHKEAFVPLWIANLTAFCLILTASVFLIHLYVSVRITERIERASVAVRRLPPPDELAINPFSQIVIEGKSAIVFDVSRNKIIYSLSEKTQLPLASITKLMTAIIASEVLPGYTAIAIVDREEEYDPKLKVGEKWSLTELLKYTLVTSSNTGADSAAVATAAFLEGNGANNETEVADDLFIILMNKKAKELGLTQTYFLNGSGLDTHAKIGGAYGSAQDVTLLVAYMLKNHYDLFKPTKEEELTFTAPDGRTIEAKNTNVLVGSIPGILGSKTGLTDLAGGNLTVVFDASFGEPFIVTVLGSTQDGRFTDVQKLIEATITYLGSGLVGVERPISAFAP